MQIDKNMATVILGALNVCYQEELFGLPPNVSAEDSRQYEALLVEGILHNWPDLGAYMNAPLYNEYA